MITICEVADKPFKISLDVYFCKRNGRDSVSVSSRNISFYRVPNIDLPLEAQAHQRKLPPCGISETLSKNLEYCGNMEIFCKIF